jgi:hypothetical protein
MNNLYGIDCSAVQCLVDYNAGSFRFIAGLPAVERTTSLLHSDRRRRQLCRVHSGDKKCNLQRTVTYVMLCYRVKAADRCQWPRGLRLGSWDCGFESRQGHVCLSFVRRAGPSSRGVLPSVMCLSVIVKTRKWGGLGPQGAVEPLEKKMAADRNTHKTFCTKKRYDNPQLPTISIMKIL